MPNNTEDMTVLFSTKSKLNSKLMTITQPKNPIMPHFLGIFLTVYPTVNTIITREHKRYHLHKAKYHTVHTEPQPLLSKGISYSKIVEVANSINDDQNNDRFEKFPLFYHLENFVQGWLVCMVSLLIFNDPSDFLNVIFPVVENRNPA
jgi:hypothetical protein